MSTNSTASPEGCSASAIHVSIMPIITYVSFHLYPRSLVRLSTATPNNVALVLKEQGNLMELVDTDLGSNFDKEQLMVMINVALLCASASPTNRPSMSSVLSMLECGVDVPDLVSDSSISEVDETKSEAMRRY
ncbi:hypothetical protein WN943_011615 [Citrus x changshan-huyou]